MFHDKIFCPGQFLAHEVQLYVLDGCRVVYSGSTAYKINLICVYSGMLTIQHL